MADITFSDEQAMLLETAADFCRNHSPIEKVRADIDTDLGIEPATWQEMAELGWLGILVPEEFGGLGLGLASVVPIVENMGRYLMGSPFGATLVATQALVTSGSEAQKNEYLANIVEGMAATVALTEADGSWVLDDIQAAGTVSGDTITLQGSKSFVLDAEFADLFIVSAIIEKYTRLLVVRKDQLPADALKREVVIDETRRSYTLNLDGIAVPLHQVLPGADFAAVEQAALFLLCAEMSGGLSGVLHVIVEYLNTRKAFDRYIGSYQALKHPAADILMSLEAMRSHLYGAATSVDEGDPMATETALRMAKAHGSEAFAFAGDRAVQFHGGFGFTYECDAQLYLRRALWCQYQFGDERYHRQLLAKLLFDQNVA